MSEYPSAASEYERRATRTYGAGVPAQDRVVTMTMREAPAFRPSNGNVLLVMRGDGDAGIVKASDDPRFRPGDEVAIHKHAGQPMSLSGERALVIQGKDILGRIER